MAAYGDFFSFRPREAKAALKDAHIIKTIPGLKLLKAQTRDIAFGKLLIIIPRAYGSAPARNLLHRRLKAIFYEEKLYEIPEIFIVIGYKEAKQLSFEEIKEFLCSAVGRKF